MKPIFEEEIIINKSREEVWTFFRNFDNAKLWMPGVESMQVRMDSLPMKVGSIIESTVNGSRQRTDVTAYEIENLLALKSIIGHFQADYSYEFTDSEMGTLVRLTATCETHGILTKLISVFIKKMIRKQDEGQLKRLKNAIEGKEEL